MFVIINLKGGENTVKLDKKLVFALILSILLLFSVSSVFAVDNETISDVVSAPSELEEITQEQVVTEVESSQSDEGMLEAGNNVINVHVYDSYNETGKTWTEDGIELKGATVKLYDNSTGSLISTQTTNNRGIASFKGLASQIYNLEFTYSTYNPIKLTDIDFTGKDGSTLNINEVMVEGNKAYQFANDQSANKPTELIDGENVKLHDHVVGNMGVINNVFGGGNAALVDGNTTVNIATEENVYVVKLVDVGNSVTGLYKRVKNETTGVISYELQGATDKAVEGSNYYQKQTVVGADIRGNVYGGGNEAEVTGNTNVVIGKRSE